MRILSVLVILLTLLGGYSGAVAAGKRVALVIGNASYVHTAPLKNPANDAEDVGRSLVSLGFEVIEGRDLDKVGMEKVIRQFASALTGAHIGLFFYAGHGLQVAGRNYLVPIDAAATASSALDFEMIRLELIQRTMEQATTTNIILLDACRDNPLTRNLARALGTRSSSIGKGLAQIEAGVGTLISYATQPGNVALDGKGRNSPYSAALKKHLSSRGQDLTSVLINVRNDVMAATANRQIPWDQHALRARLYLAGKATSANREKNTTAPRAPLSEAAMAWTATKDSTSIGVLAAFAKRFPNSVYADMANSRIEELKQDKPVRPAREITRQKAGKSAGDKDDEVVINVIRASPGVLKISHPDQNGHYIVNPKNRKFVARLTKARPSAQVRPGIYNVKFANTLWRGVRVKRGQTTLLEPAILEIKNASREGHQVISAASGKMVDFLRQARPVASMIPSIVHVRFDQSTWKNVKLAAGKTTILNPGIFKIAGKIPKRRYLPIRDADGKVVSHLRTNKTAVPLPPGSYELQLGEERIPFTLKEGKVVKLEIEYD